MQYIITLDVGTTSIKTCLFDNNFRLKEYSYIEYELYTPAKDIVELDSRIYWDAAKSSIKSVVASSKVKVQDIKVINVTTQGETMIPVDKDGKAQYNAINWLDARAVEEAEIIRDAIGDDEFYRHTGLPEVGPACPIAKIMWLAKNKPEVYKNTYKFLLLEDFLINQMTGEFVTNQSMTSSTGYFDINNCKLWSKALDLMQLTEASFPQIIKCGQIAGKLKASVSNELGLDVNTVVATSAMDQISSAIGAGNIKPGIITETTGTALVIAATMSKPDYNNPYKATYYKHYNENVLLLPYCPTAAIILKWFKNEFCYEEAEKSKTEGKSVYGMLDELAETVPPWSNGLVMLPHFAGKLSPDINSYAKGVFYGVGLDTKKAHFVRAILESIGYMLKENIEFIEDMGIKVNEIRSLGGGSKSVLWNTIKADICDKKITAMEQEESTSLGAAILGALAIGMYDSMEEIMEKFIKVRKVYIPDKTNVQMYKKGYTVYNNLYQNLKEFYKRNS